MRVRGIGIWPFAYIQHQEDLLGRKAGGGGRSTAIQAKARKRCWLLAFVTRWREEEGEKGGGGGRGVGKKGERGKEKGRGLEGREGGRVDFSVMISLNKLKIKNVAGLLSELLFESWRFSVWRILSTVGFVNEGGELWLRLGDSQVICTVGWVIGWRGGWGWLRGRIMILCSPNPIPQEVK